MFKDDLKYPHANGRNDKIRVFSVSPNNGRPINIPSFAGKLKNVKHRKFLNENN